MKQWAANRSDKFFDVLGSRYIMYGEWMYAKHTVYYDALPHYFLEFDIYDREQDIFLDTPSRREVTNAMGVYSVPVLSEGVFADRTTLLALLGPSSCKAENAPERLRQTVLREKLNPDKISAETAPTDLREGLYIKIEENGQVADCLKYVRASFMQNVQQSGGHWNDRPIVPNGLDKPLEAMLWT